MKVMGVVGAGAMGAGIAQIGLTAGLKVILFDMNADALGKARTDILGRIARLVEKGQLSDDVAKAAGDNLVVGGSLADFASADVVIEAIVERLEPKQGLFKALEAVVSADCILATNTSSLAVAAIAAGCARKERVCGLHFFNPVPLMKLVEVIVAPATSEAVAEAATALSKTLGKMPVRVKDGPGFLVNLGGRAYTTEALHIIQEGVADITTIDTIMREAAGFRMGPIELMDLTGVDVNFPASTYIYQGYQNDPRLKTTTLHESMFNAGRFGRKTKQGFHDYRDDAATAPVPPPAGAPMAFKAKVLETAPGFDVLRRDHGLDDGEGLGLLALTSGEDVATAAHRLGLDPAQAVAIDFTGLERNFLTVMGGMGGGEAAAKVADWLRSRGFGVATIKDSPGFVAPRILAMVANLGCEMAQIGVGAPEEIDLAMKLAMNYPKGPLEWAAHFGPRTVHEILKTLQVITGSDRYRPSLWLRRRAMLGLSIYQRD